MKLYITQMLRWGDTETHHYIVGAFSDKEKATYAGEVEVAWRGGKYEYRIEEAELDVNDLIDDEKELWYKECKGGENETKCNEA